MNDNKDNTSDSDTKSMGEVIRDKSGKFQPGSKPLAGFDKHPENRNNGAWKKEDTARFKLERMMEMTEGELLEIKDDPWKPMFEQKLAKAIIDGQWTVIKEMMDQVYGRKTDIDMNLRGEEGIPLIKGFVLPIAPQDFIDDSGKQKAQD